MLTKLKEVNLKLKLKKYEFAKHKIKVFSYKIDAKGIRSDPDKVKAILKQSHPTTIIEVKAFLKVAEFFKKYIKDFDKIATFLHYIISNKVSNY